MSEHSFFRAEVLHSQGQRVYGTVVLAQPLGLKWLTLVSVLFAGLVAAYFAWGSYTRKVQVTGVLVPSEGVLKLASPQGGALTSIKVIEGQVVKAGDILFEISAQRSISALTSVERQTAGQLNLKQDSLQLERANQLRLLQELQSGSKRRVSSLQSEFQQIQQEIITQKNRVQLSEQNLKRHESLVAQNFFSPAQLLQHQTDRLEQQARLQQLQRSLTSVQRELTTADAEIKQIPLRIQSQLASLERGLADLEQERTENTARQAVQIIAQQDGTITGLTASLGAVISAGSPLASLVPLTSNLQAHLFAPSQAVGFIEPGQSVMLRYSAYPYQKFGHQEGQVVAISKTSMSPIEAAAASGSVVGSFNNNQSGEPMYRITVKLAQDHIQAYGKFQPLTSGMTLEASILQERRKLWEWVFEPLYSISGKV